MRIQINENVINNKNSNRDIIELKVELLKVFVTQKLR